MTEEKYYIVETAFVGPDAERKQKSHLADMVVVSLTPGRKNMSGEECLTGWLGTTNDWHREAVGVFDESGARRKLASYGVKLPATSDVVGKFSHSHKNSEWYNLCFSY